MNDAAFDNGTDFNNWDALEPQLTIVSKICVLMTQEGLWRDEWCTEQLPALCYYDPGPAKYILVTKPMTWQQAQLYCRDNYTDLVSVRNMSENNNISALVTNHTWIGLYRYGWNQWSDQSPLTFSNFFKNQDSDPNPFSDQPLTCARLDTSTGMWTKDSCDSKYPFICYKYTTVISSVGQSSQGDNVPTVYQRTFKLRLQSSTDLNDPSVQAQLLNQLQTNLDKEQLTDLKLQWIQEDGRTFDKETAKKEEK